MPPRLSVVVAACPVDGDLLRECLDSLARQTAADIEVLVVDDGTDAAREAVAVEFADRDPRFRSLVRQVDGPAGARTAGVALCSPGSVYLAFPDGDGRLPTDAYQLLTGVLDRTGSALATGNVLRLAPDGRLQQAPEYRSAMSATREAVHITQDWRLAADRALGNKVFRRTFWEQHDLAFGADLAFGSEAAGGEDDPVALQAHFLSEAVDVLRQPVLHWRDRTADSTTRRATPGAVRNRTAHALAVAAFLRRHGNAGHKARYEAHVLGSDLLRHLEVLPNSSDEYRRETLACAVRFLDQAEPGVLKQLTPRRRTLWHLAVDGDLDQLDELLGFDRWNRGAFKVEGLFARRAAFPVLSSQPPAEVSRLAPADLPLEARLLDARWEGGKLHLTGWALVRNLPASNALHEVRAGWLRSEFGRILPLRLHRATVPQATERSGQDLHCYDRAGFTAVVDPKRLFGHGRGGGEPVDVTTWKVVLAAAAPGALKRAILKPVALAAPVPHRLADGRRVSVAFEQGLVVIRAERPRARLEGYAATAGGLLLSGTVDTAGLRGPLRLAAVSESLGAFTVPLELVGNGAGTAFSAVLPTAPFAEVAERGRFEQYELRIVDQDDAETLLDCTLSGLPFQLAQAQHPDGDRELAVTVSRHGNAVINDQLRRTVVDALGWEDDGSVVLGGRFAGHDGRALELLAQHGATNEEAVFPVRQDGERFTARLRPDVIVSAGGEFPLGEGNWQLYLREQDGGLRGGGAEGSEAEADDAPLYALRLAPDRLGAVPSVRRLGDREYTLRRRAHDTLMLVGGSLLADDERGPYRQRRLRERYEAERSAPLQPVVLYTSFDGRQFSDSPRAVHRYLAGREDRLEHVWVVRDQQAPVPAGVRTVVVGSAAWYSALARSRHIVTNAQLPGWFKRREGQFVVQTWHGTPLKRIGLDVSGMYGANPGYIAEIPERSRQWDLLVSPNSYSTPHLRRSLAYDGELMECGYPRNDMLLGPGTEGVARRVRAELGIPAGKRVILYAPTWRDDRRRGGNCSMALDLDLEAAERALAGDAVLLVRRHYMVTDRLPATLGGFVRDVSRYPDMAELLAAADVLVTDYSSMVTDYGVTGRPILLHTPDLAHYRDQMRGFCVDFEAIAPGPLLLDSDSLIDALRDPAAAAAPYADRYRAFQAQFCDRDHGDASASVGERMLQHWPGRPAPVTPPAEPALASR